MKPTTRKQIAEALRSAAAKLSASGQIVAENNRFATINLSKEAADPDFKLASLAKAGDAKLSRNNDANTEVAIPMDVTLKDGTEVKATFFLTVEELDEDTLGMTWRMVTEAGRASAKVSAASLDEFERAYLTAALWSSNDESDESGGEPLDANYGIEDIAPESIRKAKEDCKKFRTMAGELLDGVDEGQAGHDFWLTRNGHGAGFWDRRELKEGGVGKKLTDLCKKFGEINPMVGDDGQVHFE